MLGVALGRLATEGGHEQAGAFLAGVRAGVRATAVRLASAGRLHLNVAVAPVARGGPVDELLEAQASRWASRWTSKRASRSMGL